MHNKTIAFLATGDELVHGDILNTTAPWLANTLIEKGFAISQHMTVIDKESEIKKGLQTLLANNRVVITTGGLGPTSDDRTRYAIAKIANLPLVFDETSWQQIYDRITRFNFPVTENNKQQALFPQDAIILPNRNGTANGCITQFTDKTVIMLPGPPFECRGIFNEYVLPHLLSLNLHQPRFLKKWRVFDVSESVIADKLDSLMQETTAVLGYRVDYPYLEVKLNCNNKQELECLQTKVSQVLAPHFLSDTYLKSTQKLFNYLDKIKWEIFVEDNATKGYWQHQLLDYGLIQNLQFSPADKSNARYQVQITGLDDIWSSNTNDSKTKNTSLSIKIMTENQTVCQKTCSIPFRGKRSLLYGAALISHIILEILPAA